MSVIGVIPARYGSTRFPGKPLFDIAGKSLIQRVWERACSARQLTEVIVATDDQRIYNHVLSFGGQASMTSPDHKSGTDRIGEVAREQTAGYYVNIQGDEPLLPPDAINNLVSTTVEKQAEMSTLVTALDPAEDEDAIRDPNVVKAVLDNAGFAMYFSRSMVPYPRNPEHAAFNKHIGIYMYSREVLFRLCRLDQNQVEQAESLEQLRALANGIRILCVHCDYNPIGVDTPEDAEHVIERIKGEA